MVCVRGMRVRVCECGAENKAKQQNARFSSNSDSVCRYNCLFNIATPYYATFYDLLVRACSLNSTFLSNDRSLTCFITGKWRRRLLYSRTIKYCFAQIPSWDIKQNECCPPSCVYHIILKVKTWPYVFFPAVWPRSGHFTSLYLSFLICRMWFIKPTFILTKKIEWNCPYVLRSSLHILGRADPGFFPNCFSFFSLKH